MDCIYKQFLIKAGLLDKVTPFSTKKYARGFDGKRTEIIGFINCTLKIGSQEYTNLNWYVVDLTGTFNAILGAPFHDRFGLIQELRTKCQRTFGVGIQQEEESDF